jgi:hypothetical protein
MNHRALHRWLRNVRWIPDFPPDGYVWCQTCLRILKRMGVKMKPENISREDVQAIADLIVERLAPIAMAEARRVTIEEHAKWVREQPTPMPIAPPVEAPKPAKPKKPAKKKTRR